MPSERTRSKLIEARAREEIARTRLLHTVSTVKAEMAPSAIAGNAVQNVKETAANVATKTGETVSRHKGAIAAAGLATGLFLLRKPIGRFLRKRYELSRFAKRSEDEALANSDISNDNAESGPKPDPVPAASKTKELNA